jgi:hypothetical protein
MHHRGHQTFLLATIKEIKTLSWYTGFPENPRNRVFFWKETGDWWSKMGKNIPLVKIV